MSIVRNMKKKLISSYFNILKLYFLVFVKNDLKDQL